MTSSTILKGAGVEKRTRVIPLFQEPGRAAAMPPDGVSGAAAAESARLDPQAEAARVLQQARLEAERLLGQAQVELGRARAEAEQLRTQAERLRAEADARLAEVGEIIPTAAEARRLLAESEAAAAERLAEAESEAESVLAAAREQGLEEGRRHGWEEGAAQAREALRQELELAHGIAAQAKVDREQLIAAAEPEVLRLALDVARTVIAREIEADPQVLQGLVIRAMLKAAGDEPIRLRLHPETIGRLGSDLTAITERFAARGVRVVPDPTVAAAGAVVDTRSGTVDASVETQLTKIERTMLALTGE